MLGLLVAASAALAACGGNVVASGATTTSSGGGGAGGGATTTTTTTTTTSTTITTTTTGGGGAGGGLPAECSAPSNGPGPYAVTFQFTNPDPNGAPVYLRRECDLQFDVTACADGYSAPVGRSGSCSVDCADPSGGCIACGACMVDGVGVLGDAPSQASWDGSTYTFGQNAEGCPCHTAHAAPAQKYRLRVPVFATQDAAVTNQVGWTVTTDFTLPAPNGVVVVDLRPPVK
jgi:hypothetical protein